MATALQQDEDADFDPTDEFLEGDPITVEEQARAMGWKPLSEYNGDPRRWTDAEAFVKKGLEELPVLRDQNHRLTTKLTRMGTEIGNLRNTVTEQTKAVQDAIRMARTASQAGYDRAMRELEAKRREAAQTGDMDSFDQIEEQIEALETERAKVDGPPAPSGEAPAPHVPPGAQGAGLDPAVTAFTRDPANRWFFDAKRPHLKQSMIALHGAVLNEGEILDVGEQLEEARARLVEMYPEDFAGRRAAREEPAADPDDADEDDAVTERRPVVPAARRSAVGAPSRAPIVPNGRRRSPFDEIADPTERGQAKQAYERMKGMDPGLTEAEYMALYTNPHADALELRSKRKR
jgi:hypothetical protein